MPAAVAGKIQNGVDGERQHRSFDEFAALGPEHGFGFRMFAEQAAIDQRRQVLAALRRQLETLYDRIGWCHCANSRREPDETEWL